MVTLTEVQDEHFQKQSSASSDSFDYNDNDYSDTDSSISNDSYFHAGDETLWDRVSALRMIVPAATRNWVSATAARTWGLARFGLGLAGKGLWLTAATALFFGVPFAICFTEDQMYMAQEQEAQLRELGDDMLTQGGKEAAPAAPAGDLGAALLEGEGKVAAKPAL